MKEKIHPKVNTITVSCACGNSFDTLSTASEMRVEVCSGCHPFFTGTQRFVDTTGRVERFKQKIDAQKKAAEASVKKAAEASVKKAKKPAAAE